MDRYAYFVPNLLDSSDHERKDGWQSSRHKANKHSNVKKKKKLEWNYFFAENVNGRKSKIFKMEIL